MTFSGRNRRHVLTAGTLLLLVAACGGTTQKSNEAAAEATTANSTVASTAGSTAATSPGATAEVPALLQFTAPLVGGGEFAGAAYAGRATAFWFWAPT